MHEIKKSQITADLLDAEKGKIINLTNEILSLSDIEWLINKIKNASFLEEIILPVITDKNAEAMLTALEKATRNHSTLHTVNIDFSKLQNKLNDRSFILSEKIKSRLDRNRKKIFAIHGGGNMGLGLMADVISKSPGEWSIVATTSNKIIRSIINSTNSVTVRYGSADNVEQVCIHNLTMISRENNDIEWLYANASFASLCVTPVAFSEISTQIASALISRHRTDGSGLKLLILMNKPDCGEFVWKQLREDILLITKSAELTAEIISASQIIGTVVDRIVTPVNNDEIFTELTQQLQSLGVVCSTIDEMIPLIDPLHLKVTLLNAEKTYSFYVPDTFPEAYRLATVKITKNLRTIDAIKNKYINGPHVVMAWMGALMGYRTIAESINDPYILKYIEAMMDDEVGPILLAVYPDLSSNELVSLRNQFFERCRASQDDPVTRVGRDPLRKLDTGGRIRGCIELQKRHGLNIETRVLELGVAVGVLYALSDLDPANPGCQQIKEIYKKNHFSYKAVLCYRGKAPSGEFKGFDQVNDAMLLQRISIVISRLNLKINGKLLQNIFAGEFFNPSPIINLDMNLLSGSTTLFTKRAGHNSYKPSTRTSLPLLRGSNECL